MKQIEYSHLHYEKIFERYFVVFDVDIENAVADAVVSDPVAFGPIALNMHCKISTFLDSTKIF